MNIAANGPYNLGFWSADRPRQQVSPNHLGLLSAQVPAHHVGLVVGKGGATISQLRGDSGAIMVRCEHLSARCAPFLCVSAAFHCLSTFLTVSFLACPLSA